ILPKAPPVAAKADASASPTAKIPVQAKDAASQAQINRTKTMMGMPSVLPPPIAAKKPEPAVPLTPATRPLAEPLPPPRPAAPLKPEPAPSAAKPVPPVVSDTRPGLGEAAPPAAAVSPNVRRSAAKPSGGASPRPAMPSKYAPPQGKS